MKRLLKGIRIYLRYALDSIGTVFSAPIIILYASYIARKHKGSAIYLDCYHLGDLAVTMSFMPAEEGRIVIITDSKKKELADLFPEKEVKFVFCGRLIRRCILNQRCHPILPGFCYTQKIASARVLNLEDGRGRSRLVNRGFNGYVSQQRAWAAFADPTLFSNAPPHLLINSLLPCKRKLGLNWRFDASILPEALRELNPQKTIVINPYAQSIKCDIALFELIAERAAQAGYSLACHVHCGQKGAKGCASVECTLKEIGTFLASGATLIALRSGFVDTMLHTGCKIVSLLPESTPFGWRLEGSDAVALINSNVADVVINEDDYSATVDEVFQRLEELAQRERARCSST